MSEAQGEYTTQDEVNEAMDMLGKGYEEQQEITDPSDLRKYRIELPNLYDDSDLDPYEFRLLAHYKRVGTCTESTKTTAKKTHMSKSQVSEKRQSLHNKRFIVMVAVPLDQEKKTYSYKITVIDMWKENFERYSTRSRGGSTLPLSEHPFHSVNQRSNHIKKKPIKKVNGASAEPKASDIPELVLFKEVVKHYPKRAQREIVIGSIQRINSRLGHTAAIEDLTPFWEAWCKVSGNEWSLVWLEWAENGQVSSNGNGKHKPNTDDAFAEYARLHGIEYGN